MSPASFAALRRREFIQDPAPRCGFCGRIVDGDTTAIALESEAFVAHPDAFVRGVYDGARRDYEVYACGGDCLGDEA